ncbi:C-type lectin domain family 4 member G [Microcaecilia unicolor]|uniref:C-type lectin domain family 4 member G n=1 Tax=Microcaecilia unicolor TaxID=1415580 RepID=A0A6P7XKJ6_9AMPH|nr:C-type lectin domain family 4 member G [Microcaecilia unicolor]
MDKHNVYGNLGWIPPKPGRKTDSGPSSDGDYENEAAADMKKWKPMKSDKASRSKKQDKPRDKWKEFHGLEISTIEVPPLKPSRAGKEISTVEVPPLRPPRTDLAVSPVEATSFRPPNIGLNLSCTAVETAFRAPAASPPMTGDPVRKDKDKKPMTCLYFLLLVSLLLWLVLVTVAFLKFSKISEELERLHAQYSDTVRNVSETTLKAMTEQGEARTDMQRALQELQDNSVAKDLEDARKDREKIRTEVNNEMEALHKKIDSTCTLCRCPQDWHWNQGSCYYFSTDNRNWESAQEFCISKSAHLLIVEEDETRYLLDYIKPHSYWIGLRKKANVWTWVDGKPLTFSKWNYGEPNNMRQQEHCAEMYVTGKWNDFDCSIQKQWICEKK